MRRLWHSWWREVPLRMRGRFLRHLQQRQWLLHGLRSRDRNGEDGGFSFGRLRHLRRPTKRRASVRFLPLPTQLAFSLCLQKVRMSVKLEQNPVDSQEEGGPMNSERDIITVDLTEVTRANFGEFLETTDWQRAHEQPTRLVQIGQDQPLELTRAGLLQILNPGKFEPAM